MLTRKMDEHRFLLYRLKTNTEALQVERGKCEMLRWEKQTKLEKEDKVNLVSIEKDSMKQTKILIEKDKGIDVNIFMYNKEKDMLAYMEKCVETLENSIENIVENLMN